MARSTEEHWWKKPDVPKGITRLLEIENATFPNTNRETTEKKCHDLYLRKLDESAQEEFKKLEEYAQHVRDEFANQMKEKENIEQAIESETNETNSLKKEGEKQVLNELEKKEKNDSLIDLEAIEETPKKDETVILKAEQKLLIEKINLMKLEYEDIRTKARKWSDRQEKLKAECGNMEEMKLYVEDLHRNLNEEKQSKKRVMQQHNQYKEEIENLQTKFDETESMVTTLKHNEKRLEDKCKRLSTDQIRNKENNPILNTPTTETFSEIAHRAQQIESNRVGTLATKDKERNAALTSQMKNITMRMNMRRQTITDMQRTPLNDGQDVANLRKDQETDQKELDELNQSMKQIEKIKNNYKNAAKLPELFTTQEKSIHWKNIEFMKPAFNIVNGFTQAWERLVDYGEANKYNENDYKQTLSLLLAPDVYQSYKVMKEKPLAEIIKQLSEIYGRGDTLEKDLQCIKSFGRRKDETISACIGRLKLLLTKTESIIPIADRIGRMNTTLRGGVKNKCENGYRDKTVGFSNTIIRYHFLALNLGYLVELKWMQSDVKPGS